MPIIGNDYQPPPNMPTGLSLPGQGPYVPRPPQRELTLGQMGSVGLQGIAAATDIPRLLAYNLGPALVGRAGQGPQSGAEALERLGMDYDSPWQRAAGHGLGAGLDMAANPLNLLGMGSARSPLTARLERFGGPRTPPMAPEAARAAGLTRTSTPAEVAAQWERLQQTPLPSFPRSPAAAPAEAGLSIGERTIPNFRPRGDLPFNAPTDPIQGMGVGLHVGRPSRAGMPGSVQGFASDADALRSLQLNSPRFDPNAPVFGLGTGQFTQNASQAAWHGLEAAPNPLTTARFMSGAEAATPSLTRRLESMATTPSAMPPIPTGQPRTLPLGEVSPNPGPTSPVRGGQGPRTLTTPDLPSVTPPLSFQPSVSPTFNPGPMSFDPTPSPNQLLERLMHMAWPPNRPGARPVEPGFGAID